jgi:hyperosmotically inducible protein
MNRSDSRALIALVLGVLVGAAVILMWNRAPGTSTASYLSNTSTARSAPVATTGVIDTAKARQEGAELGEKAAVATQKMRDALDEAALTTKIKAKMALDDSVNARSIDVTTHGSTVTLHGTVHSVAEHDRAVALARETHGITQVIDQLKVETER